MICNHAFDRSRSMYVLIRNLGKGKCITPFIVADIFQSLSFKCCNFIQEEFNERASTRRRQALEDENEANDYEPLRSEEEVVSGGNHEETFV